MARRQQGHRSGFGCASTRSRRKASARALKPVSRLIDRHDAALAASASAFFGVYLLVRGFAVL